MAAGGTLSGIFSTLSEIIDEVGDSFQALIAALQATTVIDRDVQSTRTVTKRRKVYGSNPPKYNEEVTVTVTTDHWKVNLLEVFLFLIAMGLIVIIKGDDGRLGIQLNKAYRGPLAPLLKGGGMDFAAAGPAAMLDAWLRGNAKGYQTPAGHDPTPSFSDAHAFWEEQWRKMFGGSAHKLPDTTQ